jgi:hypothetical protein
LLTDSYYSYEIIFLEFYAKPAGMNGSKPFDPRFFALDHGKQSSVLPLFDEEKAAIDELFHCKNPHSPNLAVCRFLVKEKRRYPSIIAQKLPAKGAYHEYLRKKNVFPSGKIEF